VSKLLMGSTDDLEFFRSGQLSPAAAMRIAHRYQWLAIGLVLGNAVTLLVVFVLALLLLLGPRGQPALVVGLLLIAGAQLGVAVWIWMIGQRAQRLPVQRVKAPLGLATRGDRLQLGGREFRLLSTLQAAPEVGQLVSAYWVQPPLQRSPLALALLVEDEGS